MPGIEKKMGATTVVISSWVYHCGYVRMSRSLALRSHMFVQSEQGGYEYCWIWYRLVKLWMAKCGECGVVGNNVSISVYDGCEMFAHV